MKIALILSDGSRRPVTPLPCGERARVEGACPACRVSPLEIAGRGRRRATHDTYEATGVCLACMGVVGVIEARVSTLFGLEEDELVLHGRARVY